MTQDKKRGFTLVELSVVLVILSVLTAGVLVGMDMIRDARIKKNMAMRDRIGAAIVQFRERYDALPGDFATATSVWGAQHATPATCITTASTQILTCDGNGNGQIGESGQTYERFRFWQQLAAAGLIEGHFNGTSDLPISPFEGTEWGLYWLGSVSGNTSFFNGTYNHALILDADPSSISGPTTLSALTPQEMQGIDTKWDDGTPANGAIVVRLGDCALKADLSANATFSDLTAVYRVKGAPVCSFIQRDFVGR